jgi:hypothetical protein
MTAVSIAINRGQAGVKLSDFSVAASAPTGSADIELRFQLLDANSKALTREDIRLAMLAIERFLVQQGLQSPAGTFPYASGLGI